MAGRVQTKRTPSYPLSEIKALFNCVENLEITGTALQGARKVGLTTVGIVAVIQTIERAHFHKSMTTYADHKVWQDVYYVPYGELILYVKFQQGVIQEFMVVSFKPKEEG